MIKLYEDDELLIYHKPSGLPSHPQSGSDEPSAVAWALRDFPGLPENPLHPGQNGLCHRLDTGTSGILVFAKTPALLQYARSAWDKFAVSKTYSALVEAKAHFSGTFPREIEFPLGHSKKSAKRMLCIRHGGHLAQIRGKPLACRTEIIAHEKIRNGRYRLTLRLHGGVMHQIRCHLAEIGLPIVGDSIYGGADHERLHLHHAEIELRPDASREFTLKLRASVPF